MSAPSSTVDRVRRRPARPVAIAALGVIVALGGCQASTSPSPMPPSTGPVSPSTEPTAHPSLAPSVIPTETPPAGAGRWVDAGQLAGSPTHDLATVLGDGRVLVVGASDNRDPVAWLWGPATNGWSGTGGLPKTRESHALVTLADGRGLVVGGLNDEHQSFSSTYAFDPATEQWTKTVVLAAGRTDPAAVVLRDGRVLVMGGVFRNGPLTGAADPLILAAARLDRPGRWNTPGRDDIEPPDQGPALATTEILDPTAATATGGPPMRYARAGALATLLTDGRVLVVGSRGSEDGIRIDARAQSNAELFDPTAGTFSLTGSLPPIDVAALENGAPKGTSPIPDREPSLGNPGTLVALPDGGAVLIARSSYWKHEGDITRSFRYDRATGHWAEIGQTYVYVGEPGPVPFTMPGVPSLAGAAVARLPDGRVLIAGGVGPAVKVEGGYTNRTSDLALLFDPGRGTFGPAAKMPQPCQDAITVRLHDGSVLVFGGFAINDEGSDGLPPIRFVPPG